MKHILKGEHIMKNKISFNMLLSLFVCFMVCVCVHYTVYAQSIKLAIGNYECTRNSDCDNGYCDIDSHKCTVCSGGGGSGGDDPGGGSGGGDGDPDEEKSCTTVTDCEVGWSVVNNVCKECTSDNECSGDKPRCVSNQCVSCPTARPVWNGEYCDCPDGEINLDGTCVKCTSSKDCPSNKPVCNAVSHRCEACPTDKPRWNGEHCDCPNGEYFANGKCMKLVECYTSGNCDYPKPVCNTETGMCERCPETSPEWYGGKCTRKYKVTINNMGTITTKEMYRDEELTLGLPTFGSLTFSHWADEVDGPAVATKQIITNNVTYYAYYEATPISVPWHYPSQSFSYESYNGLVKYKFTVNGGCFHGPWGPRAAYCYDDGKNHGEAHYGYSVDGAAWTWTIKCSQYAGIGNKIVTNYQEWSRNHDARCNVGFTAEPIINYPY